MSERNPNKLLRDMLDSSQSESYRVDCAVYLAMACREGRLPDDWKPWEKSAHRWVKAERFEALQKERDLLIEIARAAEKLVDNTAKTSELRAVISDHAHYWAKMNE